MSESDSGLRIERATDSLRHKVTVVLRKAIAGGQFMPGSRLIERELCSLTGVSRTIIRESLRHLEAEGLVSTIPNKGPVVASLTLVDAEQIYEIRSALEPLAARLFTEKADDSQIAELTEAHKKLKKAFGAKDIKAIADAAHDVYEAILAGCGNAYIAEVVRRLSARVAFLRLMSMSEEGRLPISAKEMNDIVSALVARDGKRAAKASAEHVKAASISAVRVLKLRGGGSPGTAEVDSHRENA